MAKFKVSVKRARNMRLNRITGGKSLGAAISVSGLSGDLPGIGKVVDVMFSGKKATITHDDGVAYGTVDDVGAD